MELGQIIRLLLIGFALFIIFAIANSPGWVGKVVAGAIIITVIWFYFNAQKEPYIKPITLYLRNLRKECTLNHNPELRYLVLTGDRNNVSIVKGLITGGAVQRPAKEFLENPVESPVMRMNLKGKMELSVDADGNPITQVRKAITKDDKRADAYILMYTPNYGLFYDLPLVGWAFKTFLRKEFLFCVYENQLIDPTMHGDILVKGVSTRIVYGIEFVNDWKLNYEAELQHLKQEVDRLTTEDLLDYLPTIVRKAVDSSSQHTKMLDFKDDLIGGR